MEKVKITNCEEIFDGKAHSVTLEDGRKATAWNDKINAGVLMQAYASRAEIEMELKAYTSKAGKTGLNVVVIGEIGEKKTLVTKSEKIVDGHQCGLLSQKDCSIIAQCMVKCACYGRNDVTIEKALGLYHEAVLSLEQNG